MKIYIMTDIEGVAGVSEWEHGSPAGVYYERSKRLLTLEVNAAVEGALEAGATEILVWDGHGPGGIDPELLHPEALLLAGKEDPKGWGLDETFDAMFFVGQHAMSLTPDADLCHSYNSRGVYRMTLNGQDIGELGMRTILAGYFDVPVVLVTGDDKVCAEAQVLVPNVEAVAVKKSTSRQSAIAMHPTKAREAIREGAKRALQRLSEIKPCFVPGPYEFVVEPYDMAHSLPDDRSYDRPKGAPTVQRAEDFWDVAR
ncbi:MAG: M55 family metallopeptidase [Chloroflexi bacterium]|nr:M55 family metallopeptidase [Chloroflexota bacterium]